MQQHRFEPSCRCPCEPGGSLNGLVRFFTLGIYTPMWIRVTCAESASVGIQRFSPDLIIAKGARDEQIIESFRRAAEESVDSQGPVFVQF